MAPLLVGQKARHVQGPENGTTTSKTKGTSCLCTMYQLKADVDMLNAAKSVLADISSLSPSSEPFCSDEGLRLDSSANVLPLR